ncbi:hypothetical protein J6590_045037 [Homalodisca vitripennis]|nr:hypothetical protein J6590_045037 [Homalodisca vitripennis]
MFYASYYGNGRACMCGVRTLQILPLFVSYVHGGPLFTSDRVIDTASIEQILLRTVLLSDKEDGGFAFAGTTCRTYGSSVPLESPTQRETRLRHLACTHNALVKEKSKINTLYTAAYQKRATHGAERHDTQRRVFRNFGNRGNYRSLYKTAPPLRYFSRLTRPLRAYNMDPPCKGGDALGLDYTPDFHPGHHPDDDGSPVASEGGIVSDDEETQSVRCEIIENDVSTGHERQETGVHSGTTRQPTPIGRCPTEDRPLKIKKRDGTNQTAIRKVSILEMIVLWFPTIQVKSLTNVKSRMMEFLNATGPTSATEEESEIFNRLRERQDYISAFTVLSAWVSATHSHPESTLQDFVLMRQGPWSSVYAELKTAQNLTKLFKILVAGVDESPSHLTGSRQNHDGDVHSVNTGPASRSVRRSYRLCTPTTPPALRSITSRIGNRMYTAEWERNRGEYLVGMSIYRWKDVKGQNYKYWHKRAIHTSHVFGNVGEVHVEMALQRARHLRHLWFVDEEAGTDKYPGASTSSDYVLPGPKTE